jgi:hypothetical protein
MKKKTKIIIGALIGFTILIQLWKNFRGEESITKAKTNLINESDDKKTPYREAENNDEFYTVLYK